jgi:hypothetical protein
VSIAAPNVWYWKNEDKRDEIWIDIEASFNTKELKANSLYRLLILWKFVDHTAEQPVTLPLYGFLDLGAFTICVSEESQS